MCGISVIVSLDKGRSGGQASQRYAQSFKNTVHDSSRNTNNQRNENHIVLSKELEASLDRISHRGPDARGVWVSQDGRVGTLYPDGSASNGHFAL